MFPGRYVSPQVEDLEEEQAVGWEGQGELEVQEDLEEELEMGAVTEVVVAPELVDMLITEKTTLFLRMKISRSKKPISIKLLEPNYLMKMAG